MTIFTFDLTADGYALYVLSLDEEAFSGGVGTIGVEL